MKTRVFNDFTNRYFIAALLFLSLLLSGCAGGSDKAAPSSKVVASSSASSVSTADTQRPIVSGAVATVLADSVVLSVATSDNLGVISVTFLIDGDALKGVDQAGPDGNFSASFPLWVRGVGTHHFLAIAVDAAGNTTSSEEVAFVVGDNPDVTNDFTPPTVSGVEVEGNFGLVRLKAIAGDNVGVGLVEFLVDDKLTGYASPNPLADAPANQYYQLFDTASLSSGPHRLVARVRDGKNQIVTSDEVSFTVEPTAGLSEIESNDDQTSANIVAENQLQIAGKLSNTNVKVDEDYYKVEVPARKKLVVDLISTQGDAFYVQIYESNGEQVSVERERNLLGDESVSYTNGLSSKYLYIRVTGELGDFKTHNQYRLVLGYHFMPGVDTL